jgi:hypothetical protein
MHAEYIKQHAKVTLFHFIIDSDPESVNELENEGMHLATIFMVNMIIKFQ